MKPIQLLALLHYHIYPESTSVFDDSVISDLTEHELVYRVVDTICITDRGRAHIKQLEMLPPPVKAWVAYNEEVLFNV